MFPQSSLIKVIGSEKIIEENALSFDWDCAILLSGFIWLVGYILMCIIHFNARLVSEQP